MKLNKFKEIIRKLVKESMEPHELKDPDISGGISAAMISLFNSGKSFISDDDVYDVGSDNSMTDDDFERAGEYARNLSDAIAKENGYSRDEQLEGYVKNTSSEDDELSRVDSSPGGYDEKEPHDVVKGWEGIGESKLSKLKSLIKESIEELKTDGDKSYDELMKSISKSVKEDNKSHSVVKSKWKPRTYEILGLPGDRFEITAKYEDCYDVSYLRNESDRENKIDISGKDLKDFIKLKLSEKDGNYVQKQFNKSSKNSEDQTKSTEDLPKSGIKEKKVTSTKNDEKDYIQPPTEDEDQSRVPFFKEVDKFKKLSEFPVAGDKVKYTYPKQDKKEKKHIVKGGKGKELKLAATKIKKK